MRKTRQRGHSTIRFPNTNKFPLPHMLMTTRVDDEKFGIGSKASAWNFPSQRLSRWLKAIKRKFFAAIKNEEQRREWKNLLLAARRTQSAVEHLSNPPRKKSQHVAPADGEEEQRKSSFRRLLSIYSHLERFFVFFFSKFVCTEFSSLLRPLDCDKCDPSVVWSFRWVQIALIGWSTNIFWSSWR